MLFTSKQDYYTKKTHFRVSFFVRMPGLEPGTSSLSVMRSNHLSYTRDGKDYSKSIVLRNKLLFVL
jgi:hypothetical protein